MSTPKEKIRILLTKNGWEIIQVIGSDLDWWADEIWELGSVWSPKGSRIFLTYLVDPQHEGTRLKGQSVWGVGLSGTLPVTKNAAESIITTSLNDISKGQTKLLNQTLNQYRESNTVKVGI